MDDSIKGFLVVIGVIILIVIIFCWYEEREAFASEAKEQFEQGYKAACKDFYKGKLKYDLIEHEDGTRTWEKVK